jgi:hypothetical protein
LRNGVLGDTTWMNEMLERDAFGHMITGFA